MLYFLPNINKQNNMKKLLKLLFVLAVLFFANPTIYAQGNTNSSISGNV
jgi:hypothetical protein